MNTDELVLKLIDEGFEISKDGNTIIFENQNILGFIYPENWMVDEDFGYDLDGWKNNHVFVDNIDVFEKASKCPVIMKLPVDWVELKKHIDFLSTTKGKEFSEHWGVLVAEYE